MPRGRPPTRVVGPPPTQSDIDRVVTALGPRGPVITVPFRGTGTGTTPLPPGGPGDGSTQPPPTDIASPDDPNNPTTGGQRSRTFTFGAVGQIIPMNYGRPEAGGDVFFASTVGESLYMGINLSQGEIGGYIRETIDGKTLEELGISRVNRYVGDGSLITPPALLAEAGYVGIHPWRAFIEFAADRQSDDLMSIDPKNLRVIMDGLKVRDAIQDPTLATRYISENPVWCLADVMTRRHPDFKWGLGATDSMINWETTWAEAADACNTAVAVGPDPPTVAPVVVADTAPGGLYPPAGANGYVYVQVNRKADGARSIPGPESTPFFPTVEASSATITLQAGTADTTVRELYRTKRNLPVSAGPLMKVLETDLDPTVDVQVQDSKQDWQLTLVVPTSDVRGRFRIGASIQRKMSAREMIERFCSVMAATVVWQGGKFDIYVDGTQGHSGLAFGKTNITSVLRLREKGRGEIPTKVLGGYTDADNNYVAATAQWPLTDDPALDEAAGTIGAKPKVEWTFDLEWCPSLDCATRILAWAYARGNIADYDVTWRTDQRGLEVLPIASIVDLDVALVAFPPRTLKVLRVERIAGTAEYEITAEPPIELNETYTWIELQPRPPLAPPPPNEEPPLTLQILRFISWIPSPEEEEAP